jgi:hypothetical protein
MVVVGESTLVVTLELFIWMTLSAALQIPLLLLAVFIYALVYSLNLKVPT